MSAATIVSEEKTILDQERTSVVGRLARHYLLRRIIKAIVTVWVVITLTFFLIHAMPGSPIDAFISNQMSLYGIDYHTAKSMAASIFAVDLSQPMPLQYLGFMGGLLHGSLGDSLANPGTPVSTELLQYLPWTLFCVSFGLLISFVVGCLLGLIMAYRRETWLDHALSGVGSFLVSIPSFLLATLIIEFLGVQWGILPFTQMRGSLSPGVKASFSPGFVGDLFYHGALPIAVYVLSTIGTWMLTMKSSTIAALEEDYVTVARARGLSDRRIMSAYVGRNAILPVFTQLTISIGFIIGSAAAIEFVLQYQGVGYLLLTSISARDYTTIQGIFLIITVSVIVCNLLADLLYGKLDPRITAIGSGAQE
ncbi:MAG TPA: ABC transporter permease [Chloroflexota bacterium]|nr:ABC transporter permease [Chloroflexota bacterium]